MVDNEESEQRDVGNREGRKGDDISQGLYTEDPVDPVVVPLSTSSLSVSSLGLHDANVTTDPSTHSLLSPNTLLPLLTCPISLPLSSSSAKSAPCPSSPEDHLLSIPVTLYCGHTVCRIHTSASHLSPAVSTTGVGASTCPIPTCHSRNSSAEALPTTSTLLHPDADVELVFAASETPPPDPQVLSPHSPSSKDTRVDVVVKKIVSLIKRTKDALERFGDGVHVQTSVFRGEEDTDGYRDGEPEELKLAEDEDNPYLRTSRSLSPQTDNASPRKRQRLIGTRHQVGQSRVRTIAQDDNEEDLYAVFAKELFSELTCEICLALLWQPVTTPCQHVSPSSLSYHYALCIIRFVTALAPLQTYLTSLLFLPLSTFRLFVQNVSTVRWIIVRFVRYVDRSCRATRICELIRVTRLYYRYVSRRCS